jgi:hypothetical protein
MHRRAEYTARMIAGEPTYTLVDDQLVAFNAVLSMVRRAHHGKRKKNVVVVNGGPATGKSLITYLPHSRSPAEMFNMRPGVKPSPRICGACSVRGVRLK